MLEARLDYCCYRSCFFCSTFFHSSFVAASAFYSRASISARFLFSIACCSRSNSAKTPLRVPSSGKSSTSVWLSSRFLALRRSMVAFRCSFTSRSSASLVRSLLKLFVLGFQAITLRKFLVNLFDGLGKLSTLLACPLRRAKIAHEDASRNELILGLSPNVRSSRLAWVPFRTTSSRVTITLTFLDVTRYQYRSHYLS